MSNDIAALGQLVSLVAQFEKLDTAIYNSLKNNNFDTFEQAFLTKKTIKRLLSNHKPLNVGRDLGLKLKKIRDNHGYNIDRIIDALSRSLGTVFSQDSEDGIDYVDALFSEGTADYVDTGFFTRKNEVGTLIVSESLPDHFVNHFQNLRECYALGLFQATVIYCRAVIETGCFEALRRRGRVRLNSKVEDFREFSLKALMKSIRPFVIRNNWDKAATVIKKADGILHSKRQKISILQTDAYNAIKDTFAIIEELFSTGSLK